MKLFAFLSVVALLAVVGCEEKNSPPPAPQPANPAPSDTTPPPPPATPDAPENPAGGQ
jgi:hypothetical protein